MKQFIVFERALYTDTLDTRLYRYCLLRQPKLIRFLLSRIVYGFLRGVGVVEDAKFYDSRWKFLSLVKKPDKRIRGFWKNRKLAFRPEWRETLWLSRMPAMVLKPIADFYGAAVVANNYDAERGIFLEFSDYNELYREAVKIAKPSELIDAPGRYVASGPAVRYAVDGKLYASQRTAQNRRRLSIAAGFAILIAASAALAMLELYFAPTPNIRRAMFFSYFRDIRVIALNALPFALIALMMYFLTNRVWKSAVITTVVTFIPAIVNYYKLLLRDDPLMAADLSYFAEMRAMASRYSIMPTKAVVAAVILIIGALVFIGVITARRYRIRRGLSRVGGVVVVLCLALISANLYSSDAVYDSVSNYELVSQWSDTGRYISRGFAYPFLYSFKSAALTPPLGYSEEIAAEYLNGYANVDIPDAKKVNIVAVMLESFADLSVYGKVDLTYDVYKEWHALQAASYNGTLLVNVFGAGTIDTEWAFLTGNPLKDNGPRSGVNSYTRYLSGQGYKTEGAHPSYKWFYNRENVNEYMGFDNYYYFENRYGLKPDAAMPIGDDELFADIRDMYEEHAENSSAPYFNFSVTYQNHGPYDTNVKLFTTEYAARGELSQADYYALNNYLHGVSNTVDNIDETVKYFSERAEPVVLIFFGDHKPALGSNGGESVYEALGISFSGESGFENYYTTPYVIYANDAAKYALEYDFVGSGGRISPCFLMNKLFDLGQMGGDNYIFAANQAMKDTPVLPQSRLDAVEEPYRKFMYAAYYRRQTRIKS